jgi:hypothetical protein
MIPHHDPYGPILTELYAINDLNDEDRIRESLQQTQTYVQSLRRAYRNTLCRVDYACLHHRAAYLLAYYPHYIEILHHILEGLPEEVVIQLFSDQNLAACFFGAGPAPEALGWISYLNAHIPVARQALAYLFDKHADSWSTSREITRYHLAPQYWLTGKLVTRSFQNDLIGLPLHWNKMIDQAVNTSRLFVLQNCLNDQLDMLDELQETLLWLFRQTPIGSLFVIADLNFDNVLAAMQEIEQSLVESGLGLVLRSAGEGLNKFQSQIRTHRVIAEELLTGDGDLVPRRQTRFHSLVLARIRSDDDILF